MKATEWEQLAHDWEWQYGQMEKTLAREREMRREAERLWRAEWEQITETAYTLRAEVQQLRGALADVKRVAAAALDREEEDEYTKATDPLRADAAMVDRDEALKYLDRFGMMGNFRQWQRCRRSGDWEGMYE